jgi:cytosine/adenosine deaminase-related metal-dependent hydrolase/ubiquinone/menaquinone biosynthesis C-methylase UbiE
MTVSLEPENATYQADAFSAWADVYDRQQNPLLMLEERYLLRLLPRIRSSDVLDVGCGTGRWLSRLSELQPRTLRGVDSSPEMLRKADAKCIQNAQLSKGFCTDLPVQEASVDVLLASFVLSYAGDLACVAREFARVMRPGSDLFLSDMHPVTAQNLHWKRTFHNGTDEFQLPAIHKKILDILAAFTDAGYVARAILEPSFGKAEQDIFAEHGKLGRFVEAEHLPAIYLLHFSKLRTAPVPLHKRNAEQKHYFLHGGRCALGPCEGVTACVRTDDEQIEAVSSEPFAGMTRMGARIDLTGYLVLPGLINAHDHLEFSLFPKLGRGHYSNAKQWAQDIQQNDAATIAMYRRIPKRVRLWWGGIRNLLSGVTTVCHHNPADPLLLAEDFPVRVLSRFGWEHSLSFAVDICAAHRNTAEDEPFMIHACEGIDEQSIQELLTLAELGVLDRRTVLIHGLALDREGAALLNDRGVGLITCPSSNAFLFGKTPSCETLTSISRLALGSDSPLTAAGDLLDEIRFATQACAMSSQQLYSLVLDSPASMLRLGHGEGSMRPGARADLIAVRDRQCEPAEIICSLHASDIELVLLAGRVQLASAAIFEKLPAEDRVGLEPLSVDGEVRWLRAPVEALLSAAEEVLGKGAVRVGGKSVCRPRL